MSNLAPPVEPGQGWTLDSECAVSGVTFDPTRFRSGANSIRLRSRSVGPTCGHFERSISGLTGGKRYRISVWWDAQGTPTGKNATVRVDGAPVGTISGTTPAPGSWQQFVAAAPYVALSNAPILFRIDQPAGASATAFDRYFDDVEISELPDFVRGTPESLSPSASGESLSPSASATPLDDSGLPDYWG